MQLGHSQSPAAPSYSSLREAGDDSFFEAWLFHVADRSEYEIQEAKARFTPPQLPARRKESW
jgi:hypothetical protein